MGDPPKEYRDLAKFKLCPSVSNRYHRIIEASACAGKSSSPFNISVIEYHVFPSWTLDIYVSQNHEQQKYLTIGGNRSILPKGDPPPFQAGLTRPLSEWTPKSIEDEIFNYFKKTLLS